MIDIVRDYTAIGVGSAQATTARVVGAAHFGALWVATGGQPHAPDKDPDAEVGLLGALLRAPGALAGHIQQRFQQVVDRLGLVSEAEVRSLRAQVQRLERHISDLRGDR